MRICMLLHKSVEHDARVRREARALSEAGHHVAVVHLPGPEPLEAPGFELRSGAPPRWSRRLPRTLWRLLALVTIARRALAEAPDAVHAHDVAMLVPGFAAARLGGARLVYDTHEYATGVPYRKAGWAALVATIERLLVSRCDEVITVSDGIADRLQQRYRLARRPTVVRNLPDLPPPEPAPDLRQAIGARDAPLILHQGAVARDRGCENLVRALARLDSAHLLFLGAEGPYAERLSRLAGELEVDRRVHIHRPIPLRELLSYTAQADVGVSLLEDTCENHRLALPNKVFEYLAAGLPVVASRLPEVDRLVRRYAIGQTVDPADAVSVAGGLKATLDRSQDPDLLDRVKRAAAELSWSNESERLLRTYAGLGLDGRRYSDRSGGGTSEQRSHH